MLNQLFRIKDGISSRWRNIYFRARGVRLRGYALLRAVEIPRDFSSIEIEADCAIDSGVVLLCSGESSPSYKIKSYKIKIGTGTYINRNTFLDATKSLVIGRQCAIGPGCYLTDHDHGHDPSLPPLEQPLISKPTEVCDRAWIGANVTILKGVTVGSGAVVGAGSVVTKDIPAGAIAVGNPAKVIRQQTLEKVSI